MLLWSIQDITMAKRPTILMRKTAKILVEKGIKSMSAAMIQAGYSKNTAKAPTKVTNSLSWKQLMDKHFPDALVAEIQGKLLTDPHKEVIYKGKKRKLYDGDIQTRNIDIIHKLKGTYKATEVKVTGLEAYKALPQDQLDKILNGTT